MNTPWGTSQTVKQIAPGLLTVTTAGHGGLCLSAPRWLELRGKFPFRSYAGECWLEEDCDYCFAVIVWPECFSPEGVAAAVRMVNTYRPDYPGAVDMFQGARAWLAGPEGERARTTAAEYDRTRAGLWERGSMSGDKNGWIIWVTKRPAANDPAAANRTETILLPHYPESNWFTDAQVREGVAALDSMTRRQAREKIAREQREADARRRQRDIENQHEVDASGQCYSDATPGL